jgi:hypothetical protein
MVTNDSLKDKNITIFLPRLHNNFRPMIEGLVGLGLSVSVIVLRKGIIEDYSKIDITVLESFSILNRKKVNPSKIGKFYIPNLPKILQHFKLKKPQYLLIRNDHTFAYLPVLVMGKLFRCKIMLYNQYAVKNGKLVERVYNYFFYLVFKCKTISPVWHSSHIQKENQTYETDEQYEARLLSMLNFSRHNQASIWIPFGAVEIFEKPKINNSINFLSIGKFELRKNHHVAINLLHKLSEINKIKINLKIIGELTFDNDPYFASVLKQSQNSKSTYFKVDVLKNISRTETKTHLIESQYFILLSEKEVASFSQLEAFLCGCKIIIFYENGFLDFLPKHEDFKILDSLDFDANDNIINFNNSQFFNKSFIQIYFKHCNYIELAKRLISIFDSY